MAPVACVLLMLLPNEFGVALLPRLLLLLLFLVVHLLPLLLPLLPGLQVVPGLLLRRPSPRVTAPSILAPSARPRPTMGFPKHRPRITWALPHNYRKHDEQTRTIKLTDQSSLEKHHIAVVFDSGNKCLVFMSEQLLT